MIRIRRVETSLPLSRKYELELSTSEGGPQPAERVIARRGAAVRQLERIIGVGDAWSFINEADRQWAAGNRSWAVEFDAAP
jgi:hypothetical protein